MCYCIEQYKIYIIIKIEEENILVLHRLLRIPYICLEKWVFNIIVDEYLPLYLF